MLLTGVWEPTPFENFLLHSLYIINYAALLAIILLIVGIITLIIKKLKKKER